MTTASFSNGGKGPGKETPPSGQDSSSPNPESDNTKSFPHEPVEMNAGLGLRDTDSWITNPQNAPVIGALPRRIPGISTFSPGSQSLRFGYWVVDKLLGEGGVGFVYRARDERNFDDPPGSLPDQAAIKVLKYGDLEVVRRFAPRLKYEACVMANFNHPNIVSIRDFGILPTTGQMYVVMQYVHGSSMETLCPKAREGKVPGFSTSAWFREKFLHHFFDVLKALHYSHGQGIIHRDIKPANLLLEYRRNSHPATWFNQLGKVYVTDFGIALPFPVINPDAEGVPETVSKRIDRGSVFTHGGRAMGTLQYMPPEIAQERPLGVSGDVYSLSATLYQFFTGWTVFENLQVNGVPPLLNMVTYHDYTRVRKLNPDIPHPVADVCEKGLARDPASRYQTVAEFTQALALALRKTRIFSPPRDLPQ